MIVIGKLMLVLLLVALVVTAELLREQALQRAIDREISSISNQISSSPDSRAVLSSLSKRINKLKAIDLDRGQYMAVLSLERRLIGIKKFILQ